MTEQPNVKIVESKLPTAYGDIQLYKKGCGPYTVLFLHGAGSDSALLSWREVLAHLPESFTGYAIDLLGHGKSIATQPIPSEHFYDIHIDVVHEVVKQLNLQQIYLCGLSMGGAIATGYALKFSTDVKKLFLVNSWGFTSKLPSHAFTHWYIHHTNVTKFQYRLLAKSRWLAKWSIQNALIGDKQFITEQLIDEVMTSCTVSDAGKAMQQFQRSSITKQGCYPNYKAELNKLPMPILFISGDQDKLVPLKVIQSITDKVAHTELHVFQGCKHWAVKEKPVQFVQLLIQHL